MKQSTKDRAAKKRLNNVRRARIQALRTKKIIMGLFGSHDLSTQHLTENHVFGPECFYKRNTSKEYAFKRAASTPFTVEPDEQDNTTPLTALIGQDRDLSGLGLDETLETKAVPVVAEDSEGLEALEGLEPVAVEAE